MTRSPKRRTRLQEARARLLFRHLYDVSKLLLEFESVERTVPRILSVVTDAIPLRVAILVLEGTSAGAVAHSFLWHAPSVSEADLRAAEARAAAAYSSLTGSTSTRPFERISMNDEGLAPGPSVRGEPTAGDREKSFILPLVVAHGRIFGALQVHAAVPLDESDINFVNAVVNQLAVSIDRLHIAEAKQAATEAVKRAAVEAAEHLRFMAESMPQKIFTATPDGAMDYFNPQWTELTGLPVDEIKDWGWTSLLHPEDVQETVRRWRHSVETGDAFQMELRFRDAKGAYRWHLSRATPMRNGEGHVVMWIGSSTNVDDQKRAARDQQLLAQVGNILTSSLDRRATIAAVAGCAVPLFADLCLIDEVAPNGEVHREDVVFSDEKKQRGLAERARRFAQARVIESGKPLLFPQMTDDALGGGAVESMIVLPLRARGRNLGALTFVTGESGRRYSTGDLVLAEEFARRVAIAIDNAWLYEQARRATRERDDLLAVVSHDLRGPLSTILLTTSRLLKTPVIGDEWPKTRKSLETMQRSAERMTRLIGDLLDIGRLESASLAVEKKPCAVALVLREVVETHEELARQKGLRLSLDLPSEPVEVSADRERLLQILGNLIDNAIKFTQEGVIEVRAKRSNHEVIVSVTDRGSGIRPEDLAHIFDRYWQVKKTARLGVGLGLAIAKGLVEAHGGRIWVESREGEGTTFFFSLPVLASPEQTTHERSADV